MTKRNFFGDVPPAQPTQTEKKPVAEVKKVEILGLANYAIVDAAIKALTTVKGAYDALAKTNMRPVFAAAGIEAKARPANFKGFEGTVEASCQLKDVGPLALDADKLAFCKKHGISVEEVTQTEECLIFNPEIMGDQDLLRRINKALNGVKDIPENVFLKQNKVSHMVLGAKALDEVFAVKRKPDDLQALLDLVSSMAIRVTKGPADRDEAGLTTQEVEALGKMISTVFAVEAAKKKEKKSK